MNSFLFVIIILAALCAIMLLASFLHQRTVETIKPVPLSQRKNPEEEKRNLKPLKVGGYSKNLDKNRHKAALKARRQGHLRYFFHGNYFPTGLKLTNGAGR
jgi:hypothetical protein